MSAQIRLQMYYTLQLCETETAKQRKRASKKNMMTQGRIPLLLSCFLPVVVGR